MHPLAPARWGSQGAVRQTCLCSSCGANHGTEPESLGALTPSGSTRRER